LKELVKARPEAIEGAFKAFLALIADEKAGNKAKEAAGWGLREVVTANPTAVLEVTQIFIAFMRSEKADNDTKK
jgi:hypothetical protein